MPHKLNINSIFRIAESITWLVHCKPKRWPRIKMWIHKPFWKMFTLPLFTFAKKFIVIHQSLRHKNRFDLGSPPTRRNQPPLYTTQKHNSGSLLKFLCYIRKAHKSVRKNITNCYSSYYYTSFSRYLHSISAVNFLL